MRGGESVHDVINNNMPNKQHEVVERWKPESRLKCRPNSAADGSRLLSGSSSSALKSFRPECSGSNNGSTSCDISLMRREQETLGISSSEAAAKCKDVSSACSVTSNVSSL